MNINVYIIYDADGVNEPPVYGVYTNEEDAIKACEQIAKTMTEECFATNPEESGLVREYDEKHIYNECLSSLAIQVLPYGFNRFTFESDILIPEIELELRGK